MSGSASQILEGNDFFLMAKGNESREFGEMRGQLVLVDRKLAEFQGE